MSLEGIVNNESKKMTKYVITAAQKGATPNYDFLEVLDKYKEDNGVDEILVLPLAGASVKDEMLHPDLMDRDYKIITSDYNLNGKIQVSNYEIKPQQINPTTGLARFAKSGLSTIFGSPKQVNKPIPSNGHKVPKVLLTTGACTYPNYNTNNRIGRIATKDHQYGAVYVETGPRQEYHFRHLKAQTNGKMYDLGMKYEKNKSAFEHPEFLVLGDLHIGETNKRVEKANFSLIEEYKPKMLVLHDVYNGSSISHHDLGKIATKAQKSKDLELEKEIKMTSEKLNAYCSAMQGHPVYIVKSNHDEFLDRYLEDGRFINEPQNALFASKVLTGMIEGYDPLEYALSLVGDVPENVYFLQRDEELKVRGFQLGNHGDKGANGARGSIRSIENAHGKSVTAHKHTPEMIRDTYIVGTSTDLFGGYNVGLSSWMNTHMLGYKNGKGQLINIINGKWRL